MIGRLEGEGFEVAVAEGVDMQAEAERNEHKREIKEVGEQVGQRSAIHAKEGYEPVVEEDGRDSKDERVEEGEVVVTREIEDGDCGVERSDTELRKGEEQHHVLGHSVGASVREDKEDEVDIEPDGSEDKRADEERVVADLSEQSSQSGQVVIFGRLRQLRVGNGVEAAVGNRDHGGDVGGDSKDAGVLESHGSGDVIGGDERCKHGGYGCRDLEEGGYEYILGVTHSIFRLRVTVLHSVPEAVLPVSYKIRLLPVQSLNGESKP